MSRGYSDILRALSVRKVQFLVVGAHAMAAHGYVRATGDLDIWINPTSVNAKLVYQSLGDFGAPLGGLTEKDLSAKGTVFQIGIAPMRIDILTAIDGVTFEEAWNEHIAASFFDLNGIPAISRACLIKNKRSTGRLQDMADVERLEKS